MKLLKALIPAWIAVGVYAALCLWAHTHLPNVPITTHFNLRLRPDGWMLRDLALFVPLALCVVGMAVMTVLPFILPPRGALERSAKAYGAACFCIPAVFLASMGSTIVGALGWPVSPVTTIPVIFGLFFLVIGNFMTKVRYNLLFGVRTPWTLANEGVWDQTHRLAGPIIMAGGAFILIGGLLQPEWLFPIIFIGVLVPALTAMGYSYLLWRKLPPDDQRRMRAGA